MHLNNSAIQRFSFFFSSFLKYEKHKHRTPRTYTNTRWFQDLIKIINCFLYSLFVRTMSCIWNVSFGSVVDSGGSKAFIGIFLKEKEEFPGPWVSTKHILYNFWGVYLLGGDILFKIAINLQKKKCKYSMQMIFRPGSH